MTELENDTRHDPKGTASLCLDWEGIIENDGPDYILLPEGDYNFSVLSVERARFPGSAKISPCNKAVVSAQVATPKGPAFVRFDLLLHRTVEWRLSAFFRCIGQKKRGQRLVMNWGGLVGACGRAHFRPRTYTTAAGGERTVNDIDRFIDYKPEFFIVDGQEPITSDDDLPF